MVNKENVSDAELALQFVLLEQLVLMMMARLKLTSQSVFIAELVRQVVLSVQLNLTKQRGNYGKHRFY